MKTNARGGADVCLIARRFIGLNGDAPFYTLNDPDPNAHRFIVRASINEQFNTQKGGNVLVWQTADNQKGIELLGRVIDASAPRAGSIGGMVEIQSAEKVDINGWVRANGNREAGSTAGQGGQIQIQAVNGDVTGTSAPNFGPGKLEAIANTTPGQIKLISCSPVTGFPPATSNPAPIIMAGPPQCGIPQLITSLLSLLPCHGDCFCMEQALVNTQEDTLTITGHFLNLVNQLEINASNCNVGTGTTVDLNTCTKTDGQITCTNFMGSFSAGSHVLLSSPTAPSSSCSSPCSSPTAYP